MLRATAATLRMLQRLQLASLRAKVVMTRTETAVLRMLLWPRWPG